MGSSLRCIGRFSRFLGGRFRSRPSTPSLGPFSAPGNATLAPLATLVVTVFLPQALPQLGIVLGHGRLAQLPGYDIVIFAVGDIGGHSGFSGLFLLASGPTPAHGPATFGAARRRAGGSDAPLLAGAGIRGRFRRGALGIRAAASRARSTATHATPGASTRRLSARRRTAVLVKYLFLGQEPAIELLETLFQTLVERSHALAGRPGSRGPGSARRRLRACVPLAGCAARSFVGSPCGWRARPGRGRACRGAGRLLLPLRGALAGRAARPSSARGGGARPLCARWRGAGRGRARRRGARGGHTRRRGVRGGHAGGRWWGDRRDARATTRAGEGECRQKENHAPSRRPGSVSRRHRAVVTVGVPPRRGIGAPGDGLAGVRLGLRIGGPYGSILLHGRSSSCQLGGAEALPENTANIVPTKPTCPGPFCEPGDFLLRGALGIWPASSTALSCSAVST